MRRSASCDDKLATGVEHPEEGTAGLPDIGICMERDCFDSSRPAACNELTIKDRTNVTVTSNSMSCVFSKRASVKMIEVWTGLTRSRDQSADHILACIKEESKTQKVLTANVAV